MNRKEFLQQLGLSSAALMAAWCLGSLTACSNEAPALETAAVNFTLDLADPDNAPLLTDGGFIYQSDVIVARTLQGEYVALSRQCTHEGYTVEFESNAGTFYCPLHGSRFASDGSIANGPATRGLRQYNVQLTGNSLWVYA
jgi:cytochrome b6-f complex iron-sulfur subunit